MENINIENRLIKHPQVTKLSFSNQPQFLGLGELDQLPDPSKMMMRKGHSTMGRRTTVNDQQLSFNQIKGLGPVKCGITGEMHHKYPDNSSPMISRENSLRSKVNNQIESGFEKT